MIKTVINQHLNKLQATLSRQHFSGYKKTHILFSIYGANLKKLRHEH
jgi:hypothetical protein